MTGEIIVEVGADGGSIALWGRNLQANSWEFWIRTDETSAYDLLDVEDQQQLRSPVSTSTAVTSFSEGIFLLDNYPWIRLTPVRVHPEFRGNLLRVSRITP